MKIHNQFSAASSRQHTGMRYLTFCILLLSALMTACTAMVEEEFVSVRETPVAADSDNEPLRSIRTAKYNDVLTAVLRGDIEGTKQLLDMGRWVDKPGASGLTPLMAAVMNHDTEMVRLLLAYGANPADKAIELARKNNDADILWSLERQRDKLAESTPE